MDNSKIINHDFENRDEYYNSVSPPIIQTSNFVFDNVNDYRNAMNDEFNNHLYTRGNNPTVKTLRSKLAALQKTEDCLVFASGMAAISSSIYSFIDFGAHVICIDNVYGWTREFLTQLEKKMSISTSYLSSTEFNNLEDYIQDHTTMVILESPSSLMFEMQDLEAISKIAKEKNILTLIDNSYATVLNPSPADFGIDIILHSASKFIGGHSDLVAGVVCASSEIIKKIYHYGTMTLGGIIAPFDAWLMIRSLRTIEIRIAKAAETCLKIIEFLSQRNEIKTLHFPFLGSNPQKELVDKYLKRTIPMFTLELNTNDQKKIEAFCNSFEVILMGPSWGGHESLMFPTCVFIEDDPRAKLANNLIRIYIGLDSYEELEVDFKRAFKQLI